MMEKLSSNDYNALLKVIVWLIEKNYILYIINKSNIHAKTTTYLLLNNI